MLRDEEEGGGTNDKHEIKGHYSTMKRASGYAKGAGGGKGEEKKKKR